MTSEQKRFGLTDDAAKDLWLRYSQIEIPNLPVPVIRPVGQDGLGLPTPGGQRLASPVHVVTSGLASARDHLNALTALLSDGSPDRLYVLAPFTLIRGAIEALGRAAWVLNDGLAGRQLRAGLVHREEETLNKRSRDALNLLTTRTVNTPVGVAKPTLALQTGTRPELTSTGAVKTLDQLLTRSLRPGRAHWAWTVTSGIAHSYEWALNSVGIESLATPDEEGQVVKTIVMPLASVLVVLEPALHGYKATYDSATTTLGVEEA